MASDVKFAVKDAVNKQVLTPVTVSDELRDEFLAGEIIGKNDSGYQVNGLEGHNISPFIGKKEYDPGERVIVARLNDELNLISE